MSLLNTPPPTWHPQPEAPEYDLTDSSPTPPVPDLYQPGPVAVHVLPSERIILRSLFLTNTAGDIQKIVDKSESGIGCRVTIIIDPTSPGGVCIGASREDLESNITYGAYTARSVQGFFLPRLAASITPPLVIETRAALYARACGTDAFLSVMVEQFYGDS